MKAKTCSYLPQRRCLPRSSCQKPDPARPVRRAHRFTEKQISKTLSKVRRDTVWAAWRRREITFVYTRQRGQEYPRCGDTAARLRRIALNHIAARSWQSRSLFTEIDNVALLKEAEDDALASRQIHGDGRHELHLEPALFQDHRTPNAVDVPAWYPLLAPGAGVTLEYGT